MSSQVTLLLDQGNDRKKIIRAGDQLYMVHKTGGVSELKDGCVYITRPCNDGSHVPNGVVGIASEQLQLFDSSKNNLDLKNIVLGKLIFDKQKNIVGFEVIQHREFLLFSEPVFEKLPKPLHGEIFQMLLDERKNKDLTEKEQSDNLIKSFESESDLLGLAALNFLVREHRQPEEDDIECDDYLDFLQLLAEQGRSWKEKVVGLDYFLRAIRVAMQSDHATSYHLDILSLLVDFMGDGTFEVQLVANFLDYMLKTNILGQEYWKGVILEHHNMMQAIERHAAVDMPPAVRDLIPCNRDAVGIPSDSVADGDPNSGPSHASRGRLRNRWRRTVKGVH